MSLLEALKRKRQSLKSTPTTVTCIDGRCFEENKTGIVEIVGKKYGFVVDNKPDNTPARITNYVYLGSQDCCELSALTDYNIKHVLSIGIQPIFTFPGIEYKFVECLDLPETNITDVLRLHCVPFIMCAISRNENILIHCNAGVSRSSAVVIGFLMLKNCWKYDFAHDIVKKARPSIKPNIGFEKQLKMLDCARNTIE